MLLTCSIFAVSINQSSNGMKSYNMKSFLLIVLLGISSISAAQNLLDLSGNWELALDSTDVGEKEGWYLKSFSDNISLPGTTDLARKGTSNRLVPKLENRSCFV